MCLLNGRNFVEESLGCRYVETTRIEFAKSYEESSPSTPVFFILSPGVNPLKDVETLGVCYNECVLSTITDSNRYFTLNHFKSVEWYSKQLNSLKVFKPL